MICPLCNGTRGRLIIGIGSSGLALASVHHLCTVSTITSRVQVTIISTTIDMQLTYMWWIGV